MEVSSTCAMMLRMNVQNSIHDLGQQVSKTLRPKARHHLLRNLGYATAGVTVVALGLVVGRELRERYKFNRRTPYDFYSHSGDAMQDMEFGVGI